MAEMRDKPLEGVLGDIMRGLKKDGAVTEEDLAAAWGRAVGKKAAGHTRPVSVRRGVLNVNVDDSAWLYELTLKKKEILKKLDIKLKGHRPKDIRFRIGVAK